MTNNYHLAKGLYDIGFSVLPLNENKTPVVKWKRLQDERCTEDELVQWFSHRDFRPGIITGAISGIVAIDCDDNLWSDGVKMLIGRPTTSMCQFTTRGIHFICRHPGVRVQNERKIHGYNIDIRGDGGYIVAYSWSRMWDKWMLDELPTWPVHRLGESPYVRSACYNKSTDVREITE